MKQIVFALAVVFAGGAALAQESGGAQQLYQSKCASCHGKDGKGTAVGQKMGAKDFATVKASESELATVITNGRGKMPAYKEKLTKEQIDSLAKFIKNGLK